MLWWAWLACGGAPEAPVAPVEAAPVAALDSPFCPSFEACMEGLPAWGASCEAWYGGDPDCAPMDWSEGPADWIDETHRGIAALWTPGRAPEPGDGGSDLQEGAPVATTEVTKPQAKADTKVRREHK